jgi:hypothetical protein
MALQRLKIDGYGQIELNQVAFRRDGRIEAQRKLAAGIDYVENGMILVVDIENNTIGFGKDGEKFYVLNYTTEHRYDERNIGLKTFKLDKDTFLPRCGYLAKGDKFTTNCVCIGTDDNDGKVSETQVELDAVTGTYAHISSCGAILVNDVPENAIAMVAEKTTMPDGQPAIKFIAL